MKVKSVLFVVLIIFCAISFCACKKSGTEVITGKWEIINDSLRSSVGIIYTHKNYIGKPGDYFDFRTSDTLYIKENTELDTIPYQLVSNSEIIIQGMSVTENGDVEPSNIIFDGSKATIIANPSNITNPGGGYQRTINLKR